MVEVAGHLYAAVPLEPGALPSCGCCNNPYTGPWKMGRAVQWRNPDLCGHPKKTGSPCGWVVAESPCPFHVTPQEKEAEQTRKEQAAEKLRTEIAQDRAERRDALIDILSVTCPHCGAPAAVLCKTPKGQSQRGLHKARRQLADWNWPKEFLLQSYAYGRPKEVPPPLDGDLRAILDDPLTDRTAEMNDEFQKKKQAEAERKLQALQRDVWLAAAHRDEALAAVPCPHCSAAPGSPCTGSGRKHSRTHPQRVDAAMAADESL
ncbi:hypothetical protein OG357_38485 (plasmid) [Streptomyces sp. NBC_01255]|uniref:zinc finger domain-containing protein n=1 Tax=Streptomyces sp. NBC_01255 TaxID=2903798 RepID=UPI002E342A9B|nr:hypothetical protein [Streptomyces sp. NBC_01255]